MSNTILNIIFWYWHLQIGKRFSSVTWGKNQYFVEKGLKGEKKIEIYKFFNLI
jgi:hypothetical protein